MYLGDYAEDATVHIVWASSAADGGREAPSGALEEADIIILKDGSVMTLDASTITTTISVGTNAGLNHTSVDMSNDADFTTGADYAAVVYPSDETIDSQAPVGVIAHWSCENRGVQTVRGAVGSVTGAVGSVTGAVGSVTGAVGSLATQAKADVNAEVDGALETYGLDHLISASVTGTDIADDSIIAQLVSASATADWDDFDNTTDSLQNIRDELVVVDGNVDDIETAVGGLENLAASEVNAEVVDVMETDTHAEVGQGTPPATASYKQMLQYVYKSFRNKLTQTSTTWSLFADDASTVDQKATVSDSAGTYTKGEVVSGP